MSSPSQPPSPLSTSPSVAKLKSLLRQALRVTVADGRIFIGNFVGTDQPLNIILVNTEEYRIGRSGDHSGRYVGQIMVPWKLVVKVESGAREPPLNDSDNGYF